MTTCVNSDDDRYGRLSRDDDKATTSCFRESLSVDCGPRHRIRVVTDWASSSSSSSSSRDAGDDGDGDRRAEGSCIVDRKHCVVMASRHADIARQFCVGRRSCDGLRVTSRPCPHLRPADYQLLVFICVPGARLIALPAIRLSGLANARVVARVAACRCGFRGWLIPGTTSQKWFRNDTR